MVSFRYERRKYIRSNKWYRVHINKERNLVRRLRDAGKYCDRVRTVYCHGTRTGRFSSTHPNTSNVPRTANGLTTELLIY